MKIFKISTDTRIFTVAAQSKSDAEGIVIDDSFRMVLDDELPDLIQAFDIEEITHEGILRDEPREKTFEELWEEARMK